MPIALASADAPRTYETRCALDVPVLTTFCSAMCLWAEPSVHFMSAEGYRRDQERLAGVPGDPQVPHRFRKRLPR